MSAPASLLRDPARLARFGTAAAAGLAAIGSLVAAGAPTSPRSPASIPGAEFLGVTALSAGDAWAVGDVGSTSGLLKTLTVRWDGSRWTRVPSPSPGVQTAGSTLGGVSAASPSDVWAVGSFETAAKVTKTLVLHWDGTRWSQVPSPSPGAGFFGNGLGGVSALSSSDAWAVGGATIGGMGKTLVLRWDGTRWSQVPTPTPGAAHSACLADVTALSASDAWAVGSFVPSTSSGAQKPLILHWDGTRWAQVPNPAPGDTLVAELNGVAAISASNAWAVGDVFDGTTQTQRTLVFHWDGSRWARVASPSPGFSALFGVSAVSATDAWAVGLGGNSLILHWDGRRWTQP